MSRSAWTTSRTGKPFAFVAKVFQRLARKSARSRNGFLDLFSDRDDIVSTSNCKKRQREPPPESSHKPDCRPHRDLFALPLRRALVQKRVQAFAKIAAHIAHQDQILALVAG